MSIRIDERGRAHVESKVVSGRLVAIGLMTGIAIAVVGASWIHKTNIRARSQARAAAEAAEAAETAVPVPAAH